jgi:hypothetical protein
MRDMSHSADRLRIRETCRVAARVYREQAGFLLLVALVLFVPLGLVDAVSEHGPGVELEEFELAELAALAVAVVLQVVTATIGEIFYAGVAMAAVTESLEGRRRASVGRVMRSLPYGLLIAVDVLFAIGLGIGLALLIVPGLIFFARYILTAPVAEIERRGVGDTFRRSRELARGHALTLLLLLGGLWLLTDALTSVLQDGGLVALGDSLLADWAIAVATGVVITPIWAVAICVVAWRLIQAERARHAAGERVVT